MSTPYIVPLGIDAATINANLTAVTNNLQNIANIAAQTTQTINAGMQNAANAANNTHNAINGLNAGLTNEQTAAQALMQTIQNVSAQLTGLGNSASRVRDIMGQFTAQTNNASNAIGGRDGNGGLSGLLKKGAGLIAGYFGVSAIIAATKRIVEVRGEFQKFEAVLTIALGSQSEAQRGMKLLADFAAKTPTDLQEVTESYVKLVNRGFIPTREELTKIGDLAFSQGKSFDQLVEAILDAQTAEFERLKEFGIRGSKAGDQVTLSFAGVSRTVKNTEQDIRNVILEFGALPQIAGSMEAVSSTITGQISNISDGIGQLLNNIGNKLEPVINGALQAFSNLLDTVNDGVTGSGLLNFLDGAFTGFETLYQSVSRIITKIGEWLQQSGMLSKMGNILQGIFDSLGAVYDVLGKVVGLFVDWYESEGLFAFFANAIGKYLHTMIDVIAFFIDRVKEIPYVFDGIKAFIMQSISNVQNGVKALIADLKIMGLQVKQVFTFNDADTKALEDRINALRKQAQDFRKEAQGLSPAEAASRAFETARAEAEAAAKARKEARDKEARESGIVDDSPIQGRQRQEQTPGLTDAQLKAIEKAERDRVRFRQEANARLLKLNAELRKAEIDGIEDLSKREMAALEESFKHKSAELSAERTKLEEMVKAKKNYSKEAAAIDSQSIDVLSKLQVQLEKNRIKEIELLQQEQAKRRLEFLLNARNEELSLQQYSLENELEQIRIAGELRESEIRDTYKKETELRDKLLLANAEATQKAQEKARRDNAIKMLELDEQIAQSSLDLLFTYGDKRFATEERHQQALLELQIKYAKERLTQLESDSTAEGQAQVKILENQIKMMEGAMKDLQKVRGPIKPISVFEFLGIDVGSVTKADAEIINKAISDIASNTFSFLNDITDMKINAKKESIRILEEQIQESESAYNKELALQEAGYANNVDAKKAELDALQAEREKEKQQLEDAQKQKAAIQKAQLLTDSISQISNMITASTQIFTAFASIPFVGIPLAIAAIGAMFAAFAGAKAKAWQSIEAGNHAEGGIVDGKSHAHGGKKYYAMDGTHTELEGGEYVVKKSKTAEYLGVLEALNAGQEDLALRRMFSEMGIHFQPEEREKAVTAYKGGIGINNNNIVVDNGYNKYLESMDDNIQYPAAEKRNEWVVLEDNDKFTRVKQGNTTRKINK
jgi:hypothetical protein